MDTEEDTVLRKIHITCKNFKQIFEKELQIFHDKIAVVGQSVLWEHARPT